MAIRVMCCLVGQHGWIFRGPLGPVPLQILPDGNPESRLRDTRSHHLVHFHRPHARTLGKGDPDVCAHSVAVRVRRSFTETEATSRQLNTSRNPILRPPNYWQRLFVEHKRGESSGAAVDAARRAGCSTPHPAGVNMLRNATFYGFGRSLSSR